MLLSCIFTLIPLCPEGVLLAWGRSLALGAKEPMGDT